MRRLLIALFALCLGAPVLAAEVGGVKLQDKVSVGGQELVLNGAGIRTKAIFKVYDLVNALVDGLKDANTEQEVAAVKAQTDQMVAIMKAFGEVKEGNVVTLDFVDGATLIGFNGAAKGAIAGEPFNRALTRIWVGDKPVQADLRKAMLGG
jgi:predicted amino acid racemase